MWKPNEPASQNIALGKYARSKILAYAYQPFNAVDGDPETYFAIYADDKIAAGDDWLMVDLEKKYRIDRYVLISTPPVPAWRPETFTLQKSDDGFTWTDVESVTTNQNPKLERQTPPFTARYVRLYLPHGKPFFITEFELYYTETK
ncbi:MAG: F5/8 type C domain protein [Planctomycetes bacterium ADurb.Bin412]|nr:MAG: F5/8 type C domain protein [Planctomycetes bacterium ADurb.Bin412]